MPAKCEVHSFDIEDAPQLLPGLASAGWCPVSWTRVEGFSHDNYKDVMQALLRHPERMTTLLIRADVYYDSLSDKSILVDKASTSAALSSSSLLKHLKAELRPLQLDILGFEWERTIVRNLVPRNRIVDKELAQTCHVLRSATDDEVSAILYLPHVAAAEMPFYHPRVRGLCFAYQSQSISKGDTVLHSPLPHHRPSERHNEHASLSIYALPYEGVPLATLQPKLGRIALRMLETTTKHARGIANGYEKRVHHDVVVPKQRFQDTYARLKEKYASRMCAEWQEVTDPGKHVFEDIAIAAFLIELWHDIYGEAPSDCPGFVDIGCGNALLVNLLILEGYSGCGFDVRQRKSWTNYSAEVRACLSERTLVPHVLSGSATIMTEDGSEASTLKPGVLHDGLFPPRTFIISNHADELTAWTPLLAYLNNSSFIAIPCCSHDFDGARFRAPSKLRCRRHRNSCRDEATASTTSSATADSHHSRQHVPETGSLLELRAARDSPQDSGDAKAETPQVSHGAKSGKTQMSAYSTLCQYVTLVAEEVGYSPKTEMLRIPSTRNACIVGQATDHDLEADVGVDGRQERTERVRALMEAETGLGIAEVRRRWVARAGLIKSSKGSGH